MNIILRKVQKAGLLVKNYIYIDTGAIDNDYRGQLVKILFINHSDIESQVQQDDGIAQLILE